MTRIFGKTWLALGRVFAVFMLVVLVSPAQAGERYGVIIANKTYRYVPDLAYAKNDFAAAMFMDVLGISSDNIITMNDRVSMGQMVRIFGRPGAPVEETVLYRRLKRAPKDAELYLPDSARHAGAYSGGQDRGILPA